MPNKYPPDEAKARSELRVQAKAEKEQHLEDALAQERARERAVLDRTEKLKAARLAKEKAEALKRKPKDAQPPRGNIQVASAVPLPTSDPVGLAKRKRS